MAEVAKFLNDARSYRSPWSSNFIIASCRNRLRNASTSYEEAKMDLLLALIHSRNTEQVEEGIDGLVGSLVRVSTAMEMQPTFQAAINLQNEVDLQFDEAFVAGPLIDSRPLVDPGKPREDEEESDAMEEELDAEEEDLDGFRAHTWFIEPSFEDELRGFCVLPEDIGKYPKCYVQKGIFESSLLKKVKDHQRITESSYTVPERGTVHILVDGAYRPSRSSKGGRSGVGGVIFQTSPDGTVCIAIVFGRLESNYGNDYAEVAAAVKGMELGIMANQNNAILYLDSAHMCQQIRKALYQATPVVRSNTANLKFRAPPGPPRHMQVLLDQIIELRDKHFAGNGQKIECKTIPRELNFEGDLMSRVETIKGKFTFRSLQQHGKKGLFAGWFGSALKLLIKRSLKGTFLRFRPDEQGEEFGFIKRNKNYKMREDVCR